MNPFIGSATLSLEAYIVGSNYASSQAPALAVAEIDGLQQLVIAWTGTDSKHHLNVSSSFDVNPSNTWSKTIVLNQLATGGPSLAYFDNTLYIDWAGTDGNHTLNLASAEVNSLFFGTAQPVKIPGSGNFTSPNAPSLTSTANLNYEWRGEGNSISIEYYPDPANQTNPVDKPSMGTIPGITTGAPPALATFSGAFWVGWIDLSNNLQVGQVP